MLEDHAHLPPDGVNVHLGVGDDDAVEGDRAGGRLLQQVQTPQEGGLSGAGRADDHHFLPRGDVLVDVVQHQMVAEGF